MYCQICLEAYNIANRIPKNLNCGHTFCEKCLKKIGNNYEIECPKCRQKSRNNLPICYAIYDNLVIENKSDLDEPCKIHEYEKIQFYCNNDKEVICALCLCSSHKGHFVSSIKEKIECDEIVETLNKWKKYFKTKEEEFNEKKKRLLKFSESLEKQKEKLILELQENYDKIIDNYVQEKDKISLEIDELYKLETQSLTIVKEKVSELQKNYLQFVQKYKEKFSKLDQMNTDEILSLKMNEFYYEQKVFENAINDLMKLKTSIKYKCFEWNDENIFGKKEIKVEDILKEGNTTESHIVFFGDNKDKLIISYNLNTNQWNLLESTFGIDYEFLDYSAVVWLKNDLLLITGGCIYSNFKNTSSKSCYLAKFNPNNQITFYEFPSMYMERFSHGAAVLNGVPYVFGGHSGFSTLNMTEYFDEKENHWKIGGQMNQEREIFAYCTVKDRYIYIFGGFSDSHLDSIEKYDSVNHKWRLLNSRMKRPFQNASAVTISDEQIVLIGGYNGSLHRSIDLFNITTQTWVSLEKMKVPRRKSHSYKFQDKIYIFGGEGTDVEENIPEVYDLKTNSIQNIMPFEPIISKSLNFWSSAMLNFNKFN